MKRQPEREALAACIADRDAAADTLRMVQAEASEFETKYEATRDRYYAAETALTEAKSHLVAMQRVHAGDDTAMVAHAVKYGDMPPRAAAKAAEDTYARETDNFDRAKEGRHRVQGAVLAAKDQFGRAHGKADEAAEVVLQTALPSLLERAEKARAEYMAVACIVGRVSRHLAGVHVTRWASDDNSLARQANSVMHRDTFGGDWRDNQALEVQSLSHGRRPTKHCSLTPTRNSLHERGRRLQQHRFLLAHLAARGASGRHTRYEVARRRCVHRRRRAAPMRSQMRNEAAKLRRHRRELRGAVAEMTKHALDLADHIIANAPDRLVTAEEITRIEDFITDVVLKGARDERPAASGIMEGQTVVIFRERFGAQLRRQAALKAMPQGGAA